LSGLHKLPSDLPRPEDDGGCAHLVGMAMPQIRLASTADHDVDLGALGEGRTIIYCYPRTGRPGEALPNGWDEIPGARGCTPEACAFRDHAAELTALGASVFGVSTQDTAYQRELAERLHLPFAILSDADLALTSALRLPTFEVDGMCLIKRLTLVVHAGAIEHVFYPVFPPDAHAVEVAAWLRHRTSGLQA
jgi:peroxiredoxin